MVLSIYQISFLKLSKQKDIIIGFPFGSRNKFNVNESIGCYVNMIPSRLKLKSEEINISIIKEVIVNNINLIDFDTNALLKVELIDDLYQGCDLGMMITSCNNILLKLGKPKGKENVG